MYPTKEISVDSLLHRMRTMEVGSEIGLAMTPAGEYSYGIRRLPGTMFDNGSLWIADYYGGGDAEAFSEGDHNEPRMLRNAVARWLTDTGLLTDGGTVYVQVPGSCPTYVWKFTEEKQQPKKNRLACVNFEMNRPFHMYISVPPEATDDEIQDAAKKALCQMVTGEFEQKVIDDSEGRDPFIDTEDINWMEVDQDFVGFESCETELPVGTVVK